MSNQRKRVSLVPKLTAISPGCKHIPENKNHLKKEYQLFNVMWVIAGLREPVQFDDFKGKLEEKSDNFERSVDQCRQK